MAESSSSNRNCSSLGTSNIMSSKSQHLPKDIIAEILARLPFKALIRFRCVSKSWLNLISNPNSNNFAQHKLIIKQKKVVHSPELIRFYDLKSYTLQSLFSTTFHNGHSLKLDCKMYQTVGTCNGLVCFLIDAKETFIIWNPSTGESKKLSVLDKSLRFYSFGFGYDKVNDDYKVVHMGFDIGVGRTSGISVNVYSLRTNLCKKIGNFPYSCIPYPHSSLFVNGALIWNAGNGCGRGRMSSFKIVSLDLGNESYGEIANPDVGLEEFYFSLCVVEGCISICCDYFDTRADIWVMKEYGVRDSWVKLYTIPYPRIPERFMYLQYVVCNSMSGEILLKHEDMLMIYNSRYGTFEYKRIQNMFPSSPHVEMLVLSVSA